MNLRVLGALLLAAGVGGAVDAQEFQIDSTTNFGVSSTPSSEFSLSQRLDGQFLLPFDLPGTGLEMRAHALAAPMPSPASISADIDVLAVTFLYKKPAADLKALTLALGRYGFDEPTGLILSHPGDGFRFAFDYDGLELTVAAAYTGLVLRPSSGIVLTLADQSASGALLASPRFLGSVSAAIPFFSHKATFSALAQQDLNRSNLTPEWSTVFTGTQGGTLDTQYLTLKFEGPVVPRLFYETFGTFGTGSTLSWVEDKSSPTGFVYQYEPIVSFLAGGSLTYFLPEFLSTALKARVVAASGDADAASTLEGNTSGPSTLFIPVTASTLGVVFNPGLSNLLFYEAGGTLKPLGLPLVLGLKLLGFQRAVAGVVNAPAVLRTGPMWLGQEADVTATWQPFSDLAVSASAGAFLPSSGTYAPGSANDGLQYAVKTTVKLSL